ncbi:hypothetical protein HYPDE_39728 [Hyphomicrobium denitrificans 1NES1]|uniref:Serine dehydrogenasease n=1 Tax=Hyphomicrobium denitrificans 1NES1 TaxID=670307 RepID=N0B7K4_9HYPH|nr:hypothetical protein [Hyphomicrobium denitrificans]AGK59614.1 hypothetical protein HYPDE_39728 [Hyphomicrobium denitrificans 1NES1]
MKTPKANDYVEVVLKNNNKALSTHFKAHVMAIKAPIQLGLDGEIRNVIEDICNGASTVKSDHLVVFIVTTGGYIEVVERIYGVFRKHFKKVSFVVPDYAYSAGTVLVLSGDEIYMDYYSVLGPIDPQIENTDGKSVPGLGYLAKFDELAKRINSDKAGDATRAELAYLVKKFDPATLFLLEQAKNHSSSLLVEWLSKHKFKDWTKTEGTGKKVTDQMRKDRAKQVASILGNAERWHSHGRGIGLKELTSDEIKLKIVDFGGDPDLNKKIRNYYDLFIDFSHKSGARSAIHTELGFRRLQ